MIIIRIYSRIGVQYAAKPLHNGPSTKRKMSTAPVQIIHEIHLYTGRKTHYNGKVFAGPKRFRRRDLVLPYIISNTIGIIVYYRDNEQRVHDVYASTGAMYIYIRSGK